MLLVGSCGMGLMKWKCTVLGRRCFQTFGGRVISDVASELNHGQKCKNLEKQFLFLLLSSSSWKLEGLGESCS